MRVLGLVLLAGLSLAAKAADAPPSIVYILADDLGYGDVGCYNPASRIPTPHIDALAASGVRFTDMHSGSAVCTPTRYGILTGRYSWRSTLQKGVTLGPSPPIIPADRPTVASYLRERGYYTACIGKWHLGLKWAFKGGVIDYSVPVEGGPVALGFDYFFGIPASLDMPPYVYVENDRTVEAATAKAEDRTKPLYWRGGPMAPSFKHENVLPDLAAKAVELIERHAARPDKRPLFLYLPLAAPHTPVLPAAASRGRSGAGDYGDFMCDVDDAVGRVVAALEKAGLRANTLVMFTSDNGFSPSGGLGGGIEALRAMGHDPCPGLRGYKADIFEGGHRVPFVASWPGRIPAGGVRTEVAWLGDLFATAAALTGGAVPDGAAVDSESLLPALEGKPFARRPVVHHSADGYFALREGDWKLIFAPHSGGWSAPKPGSPREPGQPPVQLYNLATDLAERENLAEKHPEVVARLTGLMEQYIADGRSTAGARQANDAEIVLWKP